MIHGWPLSYTMGGTSNARNHGAVNGSWACMCESSEEIMYRFTPFH